MQLKLTSKTLLIASSQSITKIGGLIAVLIFVRVMSPREWATMAFSLTVYTAALGIGTFSLHESVYFFFARISKDLRRSFVAQTLLLLSCSAVLCAAIILAATVLVGASEIVHTGSLYWIAAAITLEITTLATPQFLIAAERTQLSALYSSAMSILQLSALLIPVLYGFEQTLVWQCVFLYAAIRFFVSNGLLMLLRLPGKISLRRSEFANQLIFAFPLALALGASVLNRSFDKWIVAWLDGQHFGAYAVAAQEIPLITVLPYSMSAVLATRIVHAIKTNDLQRALSYWLAKVGRMSVLVLPIVTAILINSEDLIILVFTEKNSAAILPFQIYTVVLFHRVAEYGMVLRAGGDTRSLWIASLILLISNMLLTVPLTYYYGMSGAAFGTLIANAISWPYALSRIAHLLGVTVKGVFPWKIYAELLAICLVWAVVVVHTIDTQKQFVDILGRTTAFLAFYSFSIWILKIKSTLHPVPNEDSTFIEDMQIHGK